MDIDLIKGAEALSAISGGQISADQALKLLIQKGLQSDVGEIDDLRTVDTPVVGNNKKLNRQLLADMELAEVIGPSEDVFREEVGYDAKGRDEYDPESYRKDYSQKYKRYIGLDGRYDPTAPVFVEDDRLRPGERIGNKLVVAPDLADSTLSAKAIADSIRSPGLELVAIERAKRNTPGEAHRRYRNYMAARQDAAELLANNLTGRPRMMEVPAREQFPVATAADLGIYKATEPAEPFAVTPRSIVEFVKNSTTNMEGERPTVASGDILREFRERALERLKPVDQAKMPMTISSPRDLAILEAAVRRQDMIKNIKYDVYEDGKFKRKVPAAQASFAELVSALGFKGLQADRLGYALGQMAASNQPARSAEAIGAIPMEARLGEEDNVAYANSDRIARGIRGVPGSAQDYPERGSLKDRLAQLDESIAPGVTKQLIGLNREDFDPRKEIRGTEGMIYNNTGQTTPEGIRMELERRGYGQRNADLAIKAQQRADKAARKIEEQIRLRNSYTPPRMRRAL